MREDKRHYEDETKKLEYQARFMTFATTFANERLDLYKQAYQDEEETVEEENIEYTVPQDEEEKDELMQYLRDHGLLSEDAQ